MRREQNTARTQHGTRWWMALAVVIAVVACTACGGAAPAARTVQARHVGTAGGAGREAAATETNIELDARAASTGTGTGTGTGVGEPGADDAVSDAHAVATLAQRFAHEPSVGHVVAATLRAGAAPRADALASRARTTGWVPQVGLKARRGQGIDLSSSSAQSDALRLSTDDTLTLEAALTFQLDRVVFAREEVALAREARAEREGAQERVRDVIALYFERRRLQLEAARSGESDIARTVRIAELEALLDVFTGGAFQRMMVGQVAP